MIERENQMHFVNVQSVVVDPMDRLWALDTGAPMLKNTVPGGPKLVCIDLKTNRIVKTILLPPESAGLNSYMNDVRFDLRAGDSGPQDPTTAVGSMPAPNPDAAAKDKMHPLAERTAGTVTGGDGHPRDGLHHGLLLRGPERHRGRGPGHRQEFPPAEPGLERPVGGAVPDVCRGPARLP